MIRLACGALCARPAAVRALLVAAVVAVVAAPARASILAFSLANYGSDNLNVEVQVDDNTSGVLSFVVSIVPTVTMPNVGDLFGVFLEFSAPHPVLSTTTSFSGADITAVNLNEIKVGGNNLEGTIAGLVPGGTFDAVLTLGKSGSSSGLLLTTSFTLSDNGGDIDLEDLIAVGVRAQTVGPPPNGGDGSSKLYDLYGTVTNPPPISTEHMPEPASALVWLSLSAIVVSGRRVRSALAA